MFQSKCPFKDNEVIFVVPSLSPPPSLSLSLPPPPLSVLKKDLTLIFQNNKGTFAALGSQVDFMFMKVYDLRVGYMPWRLLQRVGSLKIHK